MVEDLQAQLAALAAEKEAALKQHQAHVAGAEQQLAQATAAAAATEEEHRAGELLMLGTWHVAHLEGLQNRAMRACMRACCTSSNRWSANSGRRRGPREPAGQGSG